MRQYLLRVLPALFTAWFPAATSQGQTCADIPGGMVAWWRGEDSAVDAARVSDGTLQNGASFTAGMVGMAFNFDGINDFVDVPHANALNPSGAFSVEAWINAHPSQLSGDGLFVIADKSHGYVDNTGWFLQGTLTERIGFGFGNGSSFTQATTTSIVTDGLWHHVIGVYTGSELRIYFDGVLQGTAAATAPPAGNTRNVAIGRAWGGGTPARHFRGKVDDLTFYHSALTAAEVSVIHAAGTAGKCPDHPYFSTRSLSDGRVTVPYFQKLEVTLTPAPHTFQIIAGSPPDGMALTANGTLLGTPTAAGTSNFTVRVTDALGAHSDQAFTMQVDNLACVTIPPGMVAWWRGEGNALDELGRHHGTFHIDEPQYTFQFVPGRDGLAFRKPHGNSSIEFPHDAEFDAGPGEPLSIEFWWGVEYVAGPPRVFAKPIHPAYDDMANYVLRYTGAILHWGPAAWQYNLNASGLHHIVVTYQDEEWKIYANGELRATASGPGGATNAAPLVFGRGFFGILDEMALYNRALTAEEVNDLFSAPGGKRRDQLFFPLGKPRPGTVSVPYLHRLGSGPIAGPKSFSVVSGTLPPGLELTEDGSIEGTPVAAGTFPLRLRLADVFGHAVEKDFTLIIADCVGGPVAWWRADGNMLDAIGTNHGTSGTPAYGDDRHGGQSFFGAAQFQWVVIPHSEDLSFDPSEPMTIEFRAWSVQGRHHLISKGEGSLNYSLFNDSTLQWTGTDGGSASVALSPSWWGSWQHWSHVAITFDGTISKMYIDGLRVGTSVIGPLGPENTDPLRLLRRPNQYDGRIEMDDIAIYRRAMSAAEVAALNISASMGEGRCGALYIATTSPLPPAGQGLESSLTVESHLGVAPYSYSVMAGALPAGLSLSSDGRLSGTPTGYGMHRFTLKVTDSAGHEAMRKFSMDVNGKPVTPAIADRTIDELTTMTVPRESTDPYPVGNTITYSLVDPPPGAAIDSNGTITWTPTENQGPGAYSITTRVDDNGSPNLSEINTFTVTVNETNTAPVLAAIEDRTINPGQTVSFLALATDIDLPANAHTFSLVDPPNGAIIDPVTGLFSWRPELALSASTSPITVEVQDNGMPALSHTMHFNVMVNTLLPASISAVSVIDTLVTLRVEGPVGPDYTVQWSNDLSDWRDVSTQTPNSMPIEITDEVGPEVQRRFYRLLTGP